MVLVATRLVLHFLILGLVQGEPQFVEPDLIDGEILYLLNYLLNHFERVDKEISIENERSSTLEETTSTTIKTEASAAPQTFSRSNTKKNNCGAKVTAMTNIDYNSLTYHVQYWLLKPKLHLLRTLTGTRNDEFGPYREIIMRKGHHVVIAYEFPSAIPDDCSKLVAFSKKVVGYGGGEISKIIVKCGCGRVYYFKLVE